MDRIMKEPAKATSDRAKYQWTVKNHGTIQDGERVKEKTIDYASQLTNGVRPDNVFRFPTAGLARDNTIRHPAPYHKDLPTYFINLLTDEGDIVLDVFSGIGTTGLGCDNRTYIGFEMNEKYAEFSKKRLMGEKLINPKIYQYDQDDNLVGVYEYWSEVSKKYNLDRDKVRLDSAMIRLNGHINIVGYKWKLEKIKL
jgi:DNA modification methylase